MKPLISAVLCIAVSGCLSSAGEKHYFKSVDANNNPMNYYRVTVKADTFLSSSRYLSGYFDDAALDAYFNTIVQPENATLIPVAIESDQKESKKDDTPAATSGESKIKPLNKTASNRKLVLLLSSNSDEIARGLGALATSNQIYTTLSTVVGADRIRSSTSLARVADRGATRGAVLAAEGDTLLKTYAESADQKAMETAFIRYVDDVASMIQPHAPFKDLNDASQWLLLNADRGTP